MEQVSEAQLFETLDDEGNSIAVIVKHVREYAVALDDFLTTDGRSGPQSDSEFEGHRLRGRR